MTSVGKVTSKKTFTTYFYLSWTGIEHPTSSLWSERSTGWATVAVQTNIKSYHQETYISKWTLYEHPREVNHQYLSCRIPRRKLAWLTTADTVEHQLALGHKARISMFQPCVWCKVKNKFKRRGHEYHSMHKTTTRVFHGSIKYLFQFLKQISQCCIYI